MKGGRRARGTRSKTAGERRDGRDGEHQLEQVVCFCRQSVSTQTSVNGRVAALKVEPNSRGTHSSKRICVLERNEVITPFLIAVFTPNAIASTEPRIHDWMPRGGKVCSYPDAEFTTNPLHVLCAGHLRPAPNRPLLCMYRYSAGSSPSKRTRDSVAYSALWNARHERPRPFLIGQLHQVSVLTPGSDQEVSTPGLAGRRGPVLPDVFWPRKLYWLLHRRPPALLVPVPAEGWTGICRQTTNGRVSSLVRAKNKRQGWYLWQGPRLGHHFSEIRHASEAANLGLGRREPVQRLVWQPIHPWARPYAWCCSR